MNVEKLYNELKASGLPVVGCSYDGRVDFDPAYKPTAADLALAEQIKAAHDPNDYQVERQKKYLEVGCSDHELLIALWEMVVENRPEAAQALQAKRESVKVEIPKE